MNYFIFHIGDWERGTRLLSAAEKGVYLDLLTLYYSQEKPIMQMQCKRIARAYAKEEQDAMNFVLDTFFEFDGEKYSHVRCDEEIGKKNEKSLKRQKAAQCRWNANASDLHEQNECKKDAIPITINPLTNINTINTSVSHVFEEKPDELDTSSQDDSHEESDLAEDESKKNPSIPYGEIVNLYNSICVPGCVKCRMLNSSRKTLIKQRTNDLLAYWEGNASNKQDILECFRRLFNRVSKSDFLMGRTQKGQGHENWKVDLAWILKAENCTKLIEEKYR